LLAFACAVAPAAASSSIPSETMSQPGAPIRVVGCSAEEHPLSNGSNVSEQASFEDVGPKTATAVKIGFAFFDALGTRSIHSAITTGTFTPGARIDAKPFAGRIGAETRKVVCFALQAAFDDGTSWIASPRDMPRNAPSGSNASAAATAADAPAIATAILPQDGSPVRLDGCVLGGPRNGIVASALKLTNVSDRAVRRVDIDFVFYAASGNRTFHHEWIAGDYAPGATISGGAALTATDPAYAKIYCTVGRVEFSGGEPWGAGAGFLKGATPP
jgi:hypothetical protein